MAGIDLTNARRSELLEQLLAQRGQSPNIQSGAELLARLGAEMINQKKIEQLQSQEVDAQRELVEALQAGQPTSPTSVTLEDFEGGSGRQQVTIPGKKSVPSERNEAIANLPPDQQLAAMQLIAGQRELSDPTQFQQKVILQEDEQAAATERQQTQIDAEREFTADRFAQRDKELMAKMDFDELAQVRDIQSKFALLDKRIEAETAAAEASGGDFKSSQWIAAGYGVRAEAAGAVIDEIGDKFTSVASRGVGVVPQGFRTKNRQRFNQAKRNFINAQLRRESGAVISDAEFANADLQYFPQPGDEEPVLKQKAENRRIVIEALRGEAAGAYVQLKARMGNTVTTDDSNVIDFEDLP